MPVVPEPVTRRPSPAGQVWSEPSALAQVTVPVSCGLWWLVVPDRPDLNMELVVLGPLTSLLPGGIRAPASHEFTAAAPQTVIEVLGSRYPVVTKALETKSDVQSLYVALIGPAKWQAFLAVWDTLGTVLLQSDLTDQWYVDLGKTRRVAELQTEDPSFETMYIVSLETREVAPV